MPKLLLVFKFIPKEGREVELAGTLANMYNFAEDPDIDLDEDTRVTLGSLYLFLSEFVVKLSKAYENDFLMPTFGRRIGPFLKLIMPMDDIDDVASFVNLLALLVNQKLIFGEDDGITVNSLLGDDLLEEMAVVWTKEEADFDDFF